MSKRTKWTTEEERVLVDQITRSANLTEALKRTSELINRTEAACKYHWYKVVQKRDTSVCLVTIESKDKTKTKTKNVKTKNVNRNKTVSGISDNEEKTSISWWKKVLNFLKK